MSLFGISNLENLQQHLRRWIDDEIKLNNSRRDEAWSKSLAVGDDDFVNHVQDLLGNKAERRTIEVTADKYVLREMSESYTIDTNTKMDGVSINNSYFLDDI